MKTLLLFLISLPLAAQVSQVSRAVAVLPPGTTMQVTFSWYDPQPLAGTTYNVWVSGSFCRTPYQNFTKINPQPILATSYTYNSPMGHFCMYMTSVLNGWESDPSNQNSYIITPNPPLAGYPSTP